MTEPTCKDCKHWHKIEGPLDGVTVTAEDEKPGFCRGAPPSVVSVISQNRLGGIACVLQNRRPLLRPDEPICGVFQERKHVLDLEVK